MMKREKRKQILPAQTAENALPKTNIAQDDIVRDETLRPRGEHGKIARTAQYLPALLLFLFLFFPLIFFGRQFCFRDGGEFYYPLFEQIQNEINTGRLPLWDPCSNFGQPLLANPTSSVFYPGKILFFLTAVFPDAYGFCYKWYILLHFPIAFFGVYRLARHWNISSTGSILAAIAYTFSGPVFFQANNLTFLIGAAWFPWGIREGDLLIRTKKIKPFLHLALFLALMVTAGDFEIAYLCGLISFTLFLAYFFTGCFRDEPKPVEKPENHAAPMPGGGRLIRVIRSRLGLLIGAGVLGGFLSSAAILPAWTMGKHSDRFHSEIPISVWQIPRCVASDRTVPAEPNGDLASYLNRLYCANIPRRDLVLDGLFCRNFIFGKHESEIFNYSVSPFSTLELFWPQIFGNPLSASTSWANRWKGDNFWFPTLYFGIIPILLTVSAFRFRRPKAKQIPASSDRRQAAVVYWCSWTALLFFIASWGGYGPHWFYRYFHSCLIEPQNLGMSSYDPVGGLYWLMSVFLPMFATFRYPAKLMTVFLLTAAVLAGFGFDRGLESRRFRRGARTVVILSFLGLLFSVIFPVSRIFPEVFSENALLVPKDVFRKIFFSFLQPLAILAVFFALWRYFKRGRLSTAFFGAAVLFLLAIDLSLGLNKMMPNVPESAFQNASPLAEQIRREENEDHSASANGRDSQEIPPRVLLGIDMESPADLFKMRNNDYHEAYFRWRRSLLFPKFSMTEKIALVPETGTMMSGDARILGSLLFGQLTGIFEEQGNLERVLAFHGIRYVVTPDAPPFLNAKEGTFNALDGKKSKPKFGAPLPSNGWKDGVLWKNDFAASRLHIVRKKTDAANGRTPITPDGRQYTLYNLLAERMDDCFETVPSGESARITEYLPNRVRFDVRLKRPAPLLLTDQYWPGWRASRRPLDEPAGEAKTVPIEYDLGLRKIDLPSGAWSVEMVYRPTEVYLGMAFSVIALLLTAGLYARYGRKSKG